MEIPGSYLKMETHQVNALAASACRKILARQDSVLQEQIQSRISRIEKSNATIKRWWPFRWNPFLETTNPEVIKNQIFNDWLAYFNIFPRSEDEAIALCKRLSVMCEKGDWIFINDQHLAILHKYA